MNINHSISNRVPQTATPALPATTRTDSPKLPAASQTLPVTPAKALPAHLGSNIDTTA